MNTDKLHAIFASQKHVKLAYLFGSRVTGQVGPLSDYDFGVYLHGLSKSSMFDLRLGLMSELSDALKTDAVEVVVMNTTDKPELNYDIVSQGKLIYEQEPYRVLIEPRFLNEYFDFRDMLRRHGLTKA